MWASSHAPSVASLAGALTLRGASARWTPTLAPLGAQPTVAALPRASRHRGGFVVGRCDGGGSSVLHRHGGGMVFAAGDDSVVDLRVGEQQQRHGDDRRRAGRPWIRLDRRHADVKGISCPR